ncbi:MAG: HNH endonuclease [Oscillospiraceae bacterium]
MNEIISNFSHWMKQTTGLSDSSIYKYSRAVINVSNDMYGISVISKPLTEMNTIELDLAIQIILNNAAFIEKNTRGNNMYSNSLKQFRSYRTTTEETDALNQTVIELITNDTHISVTERDSLIKSRIGQGLFRTALIKKYHGTCVVTGITLKNLLIASHIKPWAVSSNSERLSAENGLLLSANYDRLFDSGLISFDDNRKIIISRYVDESNKKRLHLTDEVTANIVLSTEVKHNLEYHRDVVFLK